MLKMFKIISCCNLTHAGSSFKIMNFQEAIKMTKKYIAFKTPTSSQDLNKRNKIQDKNPVEETKRGNILEAHQNLERNKNMVDYTKLQNSNLIPVLINDSGEVLVYYNEISTFKVFLLSLKYTLPMTGLIYLIKINPFYITMPVMLPIMVFTLVTYSYSLLSFFRSLQNLVEEIWLDKSGSEVRIVYRNQSYRKLRGVQTEEKLINSALISPNTKMETLKGFKFPENPPFDEENIITLGPFWRKYYISRKNYYLLAKRAIYANFELLAHIFQGKGINISSSQVYKLEKSPNLLKKELKELNYYNIEKVRERIYNASLKK